VAGATDSVAADVRLWVTHLADMLAGDESGDLVTAIVTPLDRANRCRLADGPGLGGAIGVTAIISTLTAIGCGGDTSPLRR
jgi:hypothetical protein